MPFPTTVTDPEPDVIRHALGPLATDTPVFEPVRRFNSAAATDRIQCAIGACNQQLGITMAVMVRIPENQGEGHAIMAASSGSGAGWVLGIDASGRVYLEGSVESHGSGAIPFNDHWKLIVASHSAGKPEFWIYDLEEEELLSTQTGHEPISAPGSATLVAFGEDGGGNDRGLDFDIAAAGLWGEDAEASDVTALATVETLREWLDVELGADNEKAVGLWLFEQANALYDLIDITGNGADQTSASGTEVLGETPPIPYGSEDVVEKVVNTSTPPPVTNQLVPRGQ